VSLMNMESCCCCRFRDKSRIWVRAIVSFRLFFVDAPVLIIFVAMLCEHDFDAEHLGLS
jgi:hypothetical protein